MPDLMFIKTSSLGDVIHCMPAVSEARQHRPEARILWVVEDAYAPLVRLHPAVDEVIAVATRRWRRAPLTPRTVREIRQLVRMLRRVQCETVIDAQGLIRSAILARIARGRRHGYDARSIREPLATCFYDIRHGVSRALHAIERNRRLTGLALGYAPAGAPDYGLGRLRAGGNGYAVLLHASARREKEWPEQHWVALGAALRGRGLSLVVPWGTPSERERSERIAAANPGACVPDRQPLDGVARLIAAAALVVGIDTGLSHLAAALGVPLVAIFVASEPGLTGPMGSGAISILGGKGAPPSPDAVLTAVARTLGGGET